MTEPRKYQRFFAELKRRHVFRVMAMYGAVGFIILQSVELVIPALLLPEWTYRLVALILLIGFPIAIVLTWSFDVSPEGGLERTRSASADEIANIAAAPVSSRWPIGMAALAGTVLLGLGGWWVLSRTDDRDAGSRDYDSIAVLPFVNMTGQEELQYLGDGLAEELRNALAGIEGLKIPSMTSAAAFQEGETDIRTIGDSLGVALVLEGSVRGSSDRLRVIAQLIDVTDGYHVWSESYDQPVDDLLELQTDLTDRIVAALSRELNARNVTSIAAGGTDSARAYDYYLQGRHFWNQRTLTDMGIAIRLFEKAIAVDSSYAPAYAAIADCWAVPAGWGDDPGHALTQAIQYAHRALELNPALAEAHTALAYATMMRDLDFRSAEESFARAIELDPTYATAHQWFSELLVATGRDDEAVREVRRAEELDDTFIIKWNVARTLYFTGRYEEAIEQLQLLPEDERFGGMGLMYWVPSLIALERFDEIPDVIAHRAGEQVAGALRDSIAAARRRPGDSPKRFLIRSAETSIEVSPGGDLDWRNEFFLIGLQARVDPEAALERLAGLLLDADDVNARVAWFEVLVDPAFDPIRDDPRYRELNARFGL